MSLPAIEQLLENTAGLSAGALGASTIASAVKRRMAACGIADIAAYGHKLEADLTELQVLTETVVVPETWFFRDEKPFLALVQFVRQEWFPKNPTRTLRLLSVPCSTGEEPYSMVMALLDGGLSSDRFQVEAVDISNQHLVKAKAGRYRPVSFRGAGAACRDRHFDTVDGGYLLRQGVREEVRFQQANLLDPTFLQGREPYDVVFCRNLLIYFDGLTQKRAIRVLERLLAPQGILFVGHVETGPFLGRWKVSTRYPAAFAVRLLEDDRRADQEKPLRVKASPLVERRRPKRTAAPKPFSGRSSALHPVVARTPSQGLVQAYELADRGNLTEAVHCCTRHLEANGPDPEAYFLLALLRRAAGNHQEAAEWLRKTLYLEPQHREALLHLATLTEQLGDNEKAALLRQRAARVAGQRKDDAVRA